MSTNPLNSMYTYKHGYKEKLLFSLLVNLLEIKT